MLRPRHPIKELEAVLRSAEKQGWKVDRGKGYFKMFCTCGELHKKFVHLTPSDPNYEKNLRGYLKSRTCWKEDMP
ncbi:MULTISPECIES: hypothetical protein [Protofrankia]|nr:MULTISPECIES: hypothetical protein [Protofrankia]